jgi:hypothetical protein
MPVTVLKAELTDILPLRTLFLQENNFQIRYDSCYARGWTDSYLLSVDGIKVGYGSLWGQEAGNRKTVFEYFVLKPFRRRASELFGHFLSASGAQTIECQSNESLLTSMLFEFSPSVSSEVVLFEDHASTNHVVSGAVFRPKRSGDRMIDLDPDGQFVIELDGEIIATGGFLRHYNVPFADLYMEVRESWRNRGIGCFLLQEVKKECYLSGRVPAARCNLENKVSRATLTKAGLSVCGFMLLGRVRQGE